MCPVVRIVYICRYSLRIFPLIVSEQVFILFVTCTKYNKLCVFVNNSLDNVINKVKTFLVCQSCNHGYHKFIVVLGQAQFSLQATLVIDFLVKRFGCIVVVHLNIMLRGIYIIINAVDNTAKRMIFMTHKTVKTFAIIRHLNFTCIGVTYSRDIVREYNACFEHIGIIIKFHIGRSEHILGECRQISESLDVVNALEFQIVYGHNRFCTPEETVIFIESTEEYRHKSSLPVVTVYNIRLEAYNRENGKSSLAEKCELFNIPLYLTIGLVTTEITFVVYKVVMYALKIVLHYADIYMIGHITQIHIEACHIIEVLTVLPRNTHILRDNHTHVKLIFVEHFRQRSHNVCQSARLDKRIAL